MEKLITYLNIIIILLFILTISSCVDILETNPKTEYSDADVWGDPNLVETFINEMYRALDDPLTQRGPAVFSDEAHRRTNGAIQNFNASLMTSDNLQGWVGDRAQYRLVWHELYKNIRATNLFFENIDRVDFDGNMDLKNRMIGEVHFCRAWYYFFLARMYGGVPIITQAYQLDDEFEVPRDSFDEVIEFIVDELDKAAELLPEFHSSQNDGRATKGAAMALKSRVLVAAASDLYNTDVFPTYSNPELIGYTDKSNASRMTRWQRAKDATKAVMDLGLYNLFQGTNDSTALNFVDYFTSVSYPGEDIFVRYITPQRTGEVNIVGLSNTPVGWRGQGNTAPIGQMVDSYEMSDGTKFDWNNPEHKANPYKNRDPRFYADILYEGAYWQPRQPDFAVFDPEGILQVGTWERWDPVNNEAYLEHGLDGRRGNASPFEASETNYYARKFLDPAIYHGTEIQPITFRYIRYTEILFNYAEACIELGQYDEAKMYLNQIRARAEMPDLTESGEELRERFRNEKRVEMFLEDQRFWDIRRWVIGPETYTPVMKVEFYYPLLPDNSTSPNPIITVEELDEIKRAWNDKSYFFPILRDEMNRNSKLIQNPGY